MRLLLIISLAVATSLSAAAPLPYRAWELQDYNMEHIRRLIDLAAERGANRIQLSHDIMMYAQQPVEKPALAADVNRICDWAHAKGIKVDVWCRDLSGVPDEFIKQGRIDLTNPRTWEAIQSKYVKLLQVCPQIDGVVLSMMEGSTLIYGPKVLSDKSPSERVAQLIDKVYEVCQQHHKELFARTFAYNPTDLKAIQEGIKLCKADVIAMPKCVPHDWQPFYPYSPDIGDVGGKRQVVEFDLGHEFTGLSRIPYVMLDYMKRHLDYDIKKRVSGVVFRVERLRWWAVGTPNEAVLDIATALVVDPSADPHKLYEQWLAKRYPAPAVPHLQAAFNRTPQIVEKGLFVLGCWVTDHSKLPSYNYARSHLKERANSLWEPTEHWKEVERKLLHPTAETITEVANEKDAALQQANASLADLEQAKPYLTSADYEALKGYFVRAKTMVVVWKVAMEVIFGMDAYRESRASSDRQFLAEAADQLEKATQENRTLLIEMLADYRTPGPKPNISTSEGLVREARRVLRE
jgi:hypothetical protein